MFWGLTCEPGKKYSQIRSSPRSYHVTMATLEPREVESLPGNKQVCLMLEYEGKEFLLCILEHNRVIQQSLNLWFEPDEENIFFVNGEGTIHLSGYHASESQPHRIFHDSEIMRHPISQIASDEDEATSNDDEEEDFDDDVHGTQRLLALDDSAEEDNEEWQPSVTELEDTFGSDYLYGKRPVTRSKKGKRVNFADNDIIVDDEDDDESYVLPQLDIENDQDCIEYNSREENGAGVHDDDENEEDSLEDEEDETVELQEELLMLKKKRKQKNVTNSTSKRAKTESDGAAFKNPSIIEYVGTGLLNESKKAKKLKKKSIAAGETGLLEDSIVEQDDDMMNSSIGRTPMPKKKLSAIKAASDAMMQPVQTSTEKRSAKKPLKFSTRMKNGIEYEDLRIGAGPVAKGGKLVHVCYTGQFLNGETFDKSMDHHRPYAFRLGRGEVIKGWDFGIEGMKVGGKRRLKIPPHMGYGKKANSVIPANSTLLFNVELKAVS